jgi:hypothetical protein
MEREMLTHIRGRLICVVVIMGVFHIARAIGQTPQAGFADPVLGTWDLTV